MANSIYTDIDLNLTLNEFNDIRIREYKSAIKQAMTNIIITPIGSVRYNLQFGSNVKKLFFNKLTPAFISVAKQEIIFALENWESRITIDSIDIDLYPDEYRADIKIYYKINIINEYDELTIELQQR
ncbi:GPW/gp25 family protein [uncultured Arcobacter sp.]|uniref:GPW/gp25 family protein n=1 Tax=uncultured Arcobacter sp. TaxID=165434 RepID=UPI0026266EC6|nr:GPW/gp25 family protein [uncultured Arcobacter sp.]